MSTPGRFGQAFGQAGLGAMDDMQKLKMQLAQRQDMAQRQQLTALQMEQLKRQQAAQEQQAARLEAWRQGLTPPTGAAVNLPGMPARNATQADAAMGTPGYGPSSATDRQVSMPPTARQQGAYELAKAGEMGPAEWFKFNNPDPVKLGKDEALLDPTQGYKPIASNVAPEKAPDLVREYVYAGGDQKFGPNGFTKWVQDMKKAGAQSIGLKIENSLGTGIAGQVGPMLKDSAEAASAARQQLTNADNIIRAVDSGKILSGPTATLRLKGAQIGQMLGIGGADDAEKIINTRTAIQGLAQQTLSARAQLKGQGQVSDYEGKLIASAASGNIEDLTVPEIRKLAEVNKRLSAQVVANHQQFLSKIKAHKDPAIGSMADLFDLGAPPVGPSSTKSYNPVTGKIE